MAKEGNDGNLIVFACHIGQRVWITDADTWGRVQQMSVGRGGREYQVSYYDDEKRRQVEWMAEDEVKTAKEKV